MLTNFFKITFRKIARNKTFSALNIIGLSAGITCFILIGLLVHYELSFDTFHENRDDIYRIYRLEDSSDGIIKFATTPDPLPKTLKNDFPNIDHIIRFSGRKMNVTVGDQKFELNLMTTDTEIFEVFTFPFLYGNKAISLEDPYNAVLSYQTANKLFGSENPVGKTISIMDGTEFKISGVLEKIPTNSSIQFDLLVPVRFRQLIDPEFENKWHSSGTYTFIHCKERSEVSILESQFSGFLEKYQPEWLDNRSQLAIEKLSDIHLSKESMNEMIPVVSPSYVFLLALIGCAILLTACFNYTNLTISSYSERLKEVGVRKIMGADRKSLILQFMGETMLFAVIAMLTGAIISELLLPGFGRLVEKQIVLQLFEKPVYLSFFVGLGLIVGMISGLYPALYLSSIDSISLMKSKTSKRPNRKFSIPKILLITQFSITSTLIISMLIIYVQIQFMQNYDLGFNPKDVIAFPTNYYEIENPDEKIEAWKNHLIQNGNAHGVITGSVSEHIPGYYFNNAFGVMRASADHEDFEVMIVTSVDDAFSELYQIELKAGRLFNDKIERDKNEAVLINETAAEKFGFLDPIGQVIKFRHGEGPFTIIGVTKNIHFRSLQHQIEPVIYRHASNWKSQFIAAKIDASMSKEAIAFLSESNDMFGLKNNFDFFYVEDKYGNSYQAESKVLEIIGLFAGLAILLSCLGLFGLTGISMSQRLKEIGIRKVLGATMSQLSGLLSKSFFGPIFVACIISWPISYYLITKWLQNYPYRIAPGLHWMIAGSCIVLIIAASVILYHLFKLSRNNPIHALRDE